VPAPLEENADERSAVRERLVDLRGARPPGEAALGARLVAGVPAKARGLLRDAAAAAAAADPAATALHVHRLRGSAAMLGAGRLVGWCTELEKQALAGRADPVLAGGRELDDAVTGFAAVLTAVYRHLTEVPDGAGGHDRAGHD
jgi:HPt (histidine-containing phosphotransfer) domain-containing protein